MDKVLTTQTRGLEFVPSPKAWELPYNAVLGRWGTEDP